MYQYFAVVFMVANPQLSAMVNLHEPLEIPKEPSNPQSSEKEIVHPLGVAVGNPNAATHTELFVGPKAVDVLDSVKSYGLNSEPGAGPDLEGGIDFGTFGWFAKMVFPAVNWAHRSLV